MSKYREFKYGDLVQIEYGDRPLGIIVGEPKRRYGDSARSKAVWNQVAGKYDTIHYQIPDSVNVLEYPVLISDMEETRKHQKWYWLGGLTERWDYSEPAKMRTDIDPLIVHIHPSHLTFICDG